MSVHGIRPDDVFAIYPVNQNLTDQESKSEANVDSERPEPNRTNRGTPKGAADCAGSRDARRNKQRLQRVVPPIQRVSAQ